MGKSPSRNTALALFISMVEGRASPHEASGAPLPMSAISVPEKYGKIMSIFYHISEQSALQLFILIAYLKY